MQIINKIEPLKKIKKVTVKKLKVLNPQNFVVSMEVELKGYRYFDVFVVLSDGGISDEVRIPLSSYFPPQFIPEFAVSSECFQEEYDSGTDPRTVYEFAMATLLTDIVSASLSHNGSELFASLRVGELVIGGSIELENAKELLTPL